jgi:type IV secretory pathway TrbL component
MSRARVVFSGYQRRAVDRCLAALEADLDAITGRADAAEIELARIEAARLGPVPALVVQLLDAARAAAAQIEADGEAAAERTLASAAATAASVKAAAAHVAAARQAEAARVTSEAAHFARELHERVAAGTARRRAEAARHAAGLRDRSRSDEEARRRELARLRRRRAELRAHLEQMAAVLHEPTRMGPAAEPAEDLTARAS